MKNRTVNCKSFLFLTLAIFIPGATAIIVRCRCIALGVLILLFSFSLGVHAEHEGPETDPDTFCTGGETVPITIELGQGLPLPRQYKGSNNEDTTIRGTMLENSIFGLERIVFSRFLPEDTGVNMSENPIIPTSPSTPIDTDQVLVEFTSDATGDTVLATCDYLVTTVLPEELRNLVQLPIRWCAVEGSEQAEDKSGPQDSNGDGVLEYETVDGNKLLSLLQRMSDEIWVPGAQISFRAAFADNGIPVVADPRPPEFGDIDLGNLAISGIGSAEWNSAAFFCREAWATLYPNQRGIIVVNGNVILGTGSTVGGVAPGVPLELRTLQDALVVGSEAGTGERGDDLCGYPRNLAVSDVTPMLETAVYDQSLHGGIIYSGAGFEPTKVLAHELGHTLMLGHGNGLDDDADGLMPPDPGPRRYDDYCDFVGTTEDAATPFVNCEESSSIMRANSCRNIRPLQAEMMRAAAKLVPGAIFDTAFDPTGSVVSVGRTCELPCGLPPDIFLVEAQLSEVPGGSIASFTHTVLGPIPPTAENEYLFFVDLDDDPATGCDNSTVGLADEFDGVEVLSRVTVSNSGADPEVIATVWRCESKTLVEVADPSIAASAYNQGSPDDAEAALFSIVTVRMPTAVRGPAGAQVRLGAVARQFNGPSDRLPVGGGLGIVSLIPPELPVARAFPVILQPGQVVTVSADGLMASRPADVLLGGKVIASSSTNSGGGVEIDFSVPSNSRQGVRPLSIRVGAVSAEGFILIDGNPLTPGTVASLNPEQSGAGWNNTDVAVQLVATAIPGGTAIEKITHSTTGAESSGTVETLGSMAELTIVSEGVTTVAFFATDDDGIEEVPQNVVVMIDKTDPSIEGSATPSANSFGWNNTDVIADFECSDDRSGVRSCRGGTILTEEGENQSVNGAGDDFAGNTADTTVSGISIDKTSPVITYTGNTSPYSVLDTIDIRCTATDNLSGIAATTCVDITGPAFTFEPVTNSFSSEATDKAGNTGNGSTTFDVLVSFDDLCILTRQFIDESNQNPRKANFLGNSLCSKLNSAKRFNAAGKDKQRAQKIAVYLKQIESNNNFFSLEQAHILMEWANAL